MLEWGPVRAPSPPFLAPRPLPDEVAAIAAPEMPVREVLDRWAIVPRKRFGQNFLHDPAVCARIAALAEVGPGDEVLEIGPGLGALTRPLLDSGARVTAIEVDRRIAGYLGESLGGRDGFRLVTGDVLALDTDAVAPAATVLVGNLPYSITGPLLGRLVDAPARFVRAVVMVQREVARRLVAGAGGREIGAPAVLLRQIWRIAKAFDVGTGAFLPPPEIVSTVLRLDRIPGARLDPALRDAVNLAYRQRRKMLRKTLRDAVAPEEALAAALRALGLPDAARPEDLSPEDWPRLLEAVRGSLAPPVPDDPLAGAEGA